MPVHEVSEFVFRNPVSAATHLAWVGFSIFATALMWRMAGGDGRRQFCAACYGLSMILLYAASGTYHALIIDPKSLNFFRLLDHSAIYVLIAGTYTPIVALLMKRPWSTVILVVQWSIAVVGILCKWLVAAPPYEVCVGLYVAMGWVGLLPLPLLLRAVGWRGMSWVMGGGILYTLGGVCDAINWPVLLPGIVGPHEVLHICDMAATGLHVYFVAFYVMPYRPVAVPARLPMVAVSAAPATRLVVS